MNFEPQKFFIGVIDFFSVLLPGALITYLYHEPLCRFVLGHPCPSGTTGWILFFFTSYLTGHFIFLLGSLLLDKAFYDRLRSATPGQRISRLAGGKRLPSRLARSLAGLGGNGSGDALSQVKLLREHDLKDFGPPAMNAFQWSKARLTLDHPPALAVVQRFEADSKFFRSLAIVLLIPTTLWFVSGRSALGLGGLAMIGFSIWRYCDQRTKAIDQAYWYVIALESRRQGGFSRQRNSTKEAPTHAGGVVFRRVNSGLEFLLVRARRDPEKVLPKGHIEPGESAGEAAVREIHEEAGVWARVMRRLPMDRFTRNGEEIRVQYFLMEFLSAEEALEPDRPHWWFPLDAAVREASHDSIRKTLKAAADELGAAATPRG